MLKPVQRVGRFFQIKCRQTNEEEIFDKIARHLDIRYILEELEKRDDEVVISNEGLDIGPDLAP